MIRHTHQPCLTCAKMIISAGIRKVIYAGHYPDENAVAFLSQAGVELAHYSISPGETILAEQMD